MQIISPNPQINCLIARAVVDKSIFLDKFLKPSDAAVGQAFNYALYCRWNDAEFEHYGKDTLERIKKEKDGKLIEFYWIYKNNFNIKVPWGIPENAINPGINGELTFNAEEITIEKILKMRTYMDVSLWQTEVKDFVRYEYLSEYFIDSKGEQSGISIVLRDRIIPSIEGELTGIQFKDLKYEQLKAKILQGARNCAEYYRAMGLSMDEKNISFKVMKK